jgi:hypothetical protein
MHNNPLIKVEYARNTGQLPKTVYDSIVNRFHIVKEGITRIEKTSELKYPCYYIEPNLMISTSTIEFTKFGIFFARTIPVLNECNQLNIAVQLTAPLISYGLLRTVHAILAHEFIHYVNLISRIMKMNMISDEISGTLFEGTYKDSDHLLESHVVFKHDPTLIEDISEKFSGGFKDLRLEEKVIKQWMGKHLPIVTVPIDTNIIKIPFEVLANLEFDHIIKEKIIEFENNKTTKKRSSDYV